MRVNDAVTGAALVLLALAVIGYSLSFPSIQGQPYGPGLFPIMIGVALVICGVALVVKGLAERRTDPLVQLPDWARSPRLAVSFVLGIGGTVFYIYAVDVLGFVLTGFLLLGILFLWLRGRPLSSLALAAGITLATHVVFHDVLLVPLPWGLLQPLAW